MRRLILGLTVIVLLAQAQTLVAEVLLYDISDQESKAHDALARLGLVQEEHYEADASGDFYKTAISTNFNDLLNDSEYAWDLVIMDVPSAIPTNGFDDLITYIDDGGKVVMSYWGGAQQEQDVLGPAFDISFNGSFSTPQNVCPWDTAHPIFNNPHQLDELTQWADNVNDDGDKLALQPEAGAVALAGFTNVETSGEAAIVLGNEGRTLYNGFLFDELDDPAGTDLIENEIRFLLYGANPVPEPSSLAMFAGLGVMGLIAARRRKRAA